MSGAEAGFALSVFLACSVEAVEALTIVMAVGQTRSWPSALGGAGAAAAGLALAVAIAGDALTHVPLDTLRIVVGVLLFVFGAQWLRKAVLRAAGRKALRDELRSYAHEAGAARDQDSPAGRWDPYSFAVTLKG